MALVEQMERHDLPLHYFFINKTVFLDSLEKYVQMLLDSPYDAFARP